MIKRVIATIPVVALLLVGSISMAQTKTPLLAPVDPLAWAVVNTDWGPFGAAQLKNLREVVNGQVRNHEINNSRTDFNTGVVQRLRCFDPANCVMCSPDVMKYARRMQDQLRASSGAIQGNSSNLAALATYYEQQAAAEKERERLNADRSYMMTEVQNVDGRDVVTTKTVTFSTPGNGGPAHAQQLANQLRGQLAQQNQQQGMAFYAYIKAAEETIRKPKPAIVLNLGGETSSQAGAASASSAVPDL